MKEKTVAVWGSVLLALTISCLNTNCKKSDSTLDQQEISGAAPDWNLVTASAQNIDLSVHARGIIKPSVGSEVRVGSRISGIVSKLHVKIGDQIAKGQLLAELDPTELEAKLNQAQAALNNARAHLEYARPDVERKRKLIARNLISQSELDRAERSYEVAISEVEQADANLEYARIQVRYTKIHAPIPGVVASVSTQEGETVAASLSAPTFVTIVDLGRLEVWAYVDETQIGRVKVGQEAVFRVDTYPNTDFAGTVSAIYPKAEMQEDGVKYVAVLRTRVDPEKPLRPEMTTAVSILLGEKQNVLAVPNPAVHQDNGEYFVYVLRSESPTKQIVKVGSKDKNHTEILEGIESGEKVIVGYFR